MKPSRMIIVGWLVVAVFVVSWLGMMWVHELGHVVNAWLCGGHVERVVLHPLRFSRTDLLVNPHPLVVRGAGWCGAHWCR